MKPGMRGPGPVPGTQWGFRKSGPPALLCPCSLSRMGGDILTLPHMSSHSPRHVHSAYIIRGSGAAGIVLIPLSTKQMKRGPIEVQRPLLQVVPLCGWDLNSGSLPCPGSWLVGKGRLQGRGCPGRASTTVLTLGLGTQSGGMTNCTPEAAHGPGTPCRPARGRRRPSFLVSFRPQGRSGQRRV